LLLETIIKNKSVQGLSIDPNSNLNISCEDCLESKAVHIQFPKNALSRGEKPRDLTHCNLWGPYRQPSLKKENYFISFTDDKSWYITMKYLKKKDNTETEIKNYIEWIETQFERRPKAFKFDGGQEFLLGKLPKYFAKKGIEMGKTAPYSPSQNGVVE